MQSSSQIFCIHFMRSFLEIFTFVAADFTLSKWLDFENLLISFEIIAICFQCNHHFRYFALISWDHSWRFSRSWLQISLFRNDSILNTCWYRSRSRSRSLQSVFNAVIISGILHSFHEIIFGDFHVRDCRSHFLEMTRFWTFVDIVRDLVRDHCNLFSMQSSSQIFCIHFMRSFLEIFTFVAADLILSKWLDSEHLLISFEISFENIAICFLFSHHFEYSALISWDHSRRFSHSVAADFIISKWLDFGSLLISFEIIAICFLFSHFLGYSAPISWNHSRRFSHSVAAGFIISKWLDFGSLLISFEIIAICFLFSHLLGYSASISWGYSRKSSHSVVADFIISKWLDFGSLLISFEIIAICFLFSHFLEYSASISWDHSRKSSHSVAADFIISKWLDFGSLLTSFEISFEIIAICFLFSHYLRYSALISWGHSWRFSRSWLQTSLSRNDSILGACWYRSRSRSRTLQSVFNAVIISGILHPFHEIILGDFHARLLQSFSSPNDSILSFC